MGRGERSMVEGVEIAQARRVGQIDTAVEDEGHLLFVQPPMAAQRLAQGGEIVTVFAGAKGGVRPREEHQMAARRAAIPPGGASGGR